jgi:hypothetical protein
MGGVFFCQSFVKQARELGGALGGASGEVGFARGGFWTCLLVDISLPIRRQSRDAKRPVHLMNREL